ncbi:sugar ABC transporter substrate-binding protein [Streptomyces albidus (ex Kaewkla and Franco 2022)]|uniref:sugar ABC transporter substrate-binding protein n=1 Tax=Streptomyces albidus (ex Kaewkla and Franco 2022) TaxID=722709 RepID=UPI0015EF70CA|nr:sugar ABC transporter substrate-binding protein [Streptomyces albidus (ex Kaewkla and Franco 2022)]
MQAIPRIAAATAATAAFALLLSACGSGGSEQTSAKDKQTLTVWGMGEEGKHLAKIGKEFNKKHPNITVKVTPVGWDVVHQKLVSAVAAGELPDMAQMGSTMLGEFIELDAIEPVDEKTFKKDDYFPAAWNGGVKDGKAYGVPWYVDTRALYYRTDLAKKAGVDEPPATWEDQRKLAEAYKDKAKTKWGTYNQPANTGVWQTWLPFLHSAGGELLDKSGKPALDSPESVEALTEYAHYFEKGLSRKSSPPDYDVVKDFGTGDAPMFISGPWIVQNIQDQQPQLKGKYATAPLPAGKSSTSWVGGASLVTFKESQHKAAAEEFTKYLTDTKQQAAWYEMAKSLPAKEAAFDEPQLKNAPEQLAAFEEQLKTAKTVPPLAKWEEFASKMDEGIARISQKGESPEKAAAWMQKATEGLVD